MPAVPRQDAMLSPAGMTKRLGLFKATSDGFPRSPVTLMLAPHPLYWRIP